MYKAQPLAIYFTPPYCTLLHPSFSTLMKKHQHTVFHGLARLVRWVDHVSLAIEGREVTPKLSDQTIIASQSVIKVSG